MKPQWIIDTGPLVAYLNKADKYHGWVIEQFNQIQPPFLTCESVISEALFLLTPSKEAIYQLLTFITDDYLKIYFSCLSGCHILLDSWRKSDLSYTSR